jgi:RNA polymerase-binding protein DksA
MAKKQVKAAKSPPRKSAGKKSAASGKKPAARKPAPKKIAKKKAAKKPAAKKPVTKSKPSPKKKSMPKKAAAKKPAPKKPAAKKPAAKKAPVKPASAKKTSSTADKSPKKAPAKKPVAAKPAGKAPVADSKTEALKGAARAAASRTALAKARAAAAEPAPAEPNQPTGSYNGVMLTDQIKPFPKKTPYSAKELQTLRETLSMERDQLMRELASLDSTNREVMDLSKEHPGYSLHLAEHATDLQTAEASLGVRSIVRERLEQVDNALKRIKDAKANYGLCLACGAKIGIQRLSARPHAHLCMDCRQRYERIRNRRQA